jgi:hypothetical protein
MVAWLNSVRSRIKDGTLLPAAYFQELNCDAALEARDRAEFDMEWSRQFAEVQSRWAEATMPTDARALAEDIRQESFFAVSHTTRLHEIARYVWDDFDLIVRGRLVGVKSAFLNRLWAAYVRGEFPK